MAATLHLRSRVPAARRALRARPVLLGTRDFFVFSLSGKLCTVKLSLFYGQEIGEQWVGSCGGRSGLADP